MCALRIKRRCPPSILAYRLEDDRHARKPRTGTHPKRAKPIRLLVFFLVAPVWSTRRRRCATYWHPLPREDATRAPQGVGVFFFEGLNRRTTNRDHWTTWWHPPPRYNAPRAKTKLTRIHQICENHRIHVLVCFSLPSWQLGRNSESQKRKHEMK